MGEITRRMFLKLTGYAGAGAVAGGLGAKAAEKLIPYVIPPTQQFRPGVWNAFATTCRECPAGCGMHLKFTEGRVTKAEGNPDHPVGHGALCARGQSCVQGLYDPDRLQHVLARSGGRGGKLEHSNWQAAFEAIAKRLAAGGRVVVISDLQTGALADVMERLAKAFGSPPPAYCEAFNYEPLKAANAVLFGMPVIPQYRLDQAEAILSFGVDFLETWLSPVQFAHDFAKLHTYRDKKLGRFVYLGPRYSMTAANADTFRKVPPGAEISILAAMLKLIQDSGWAKADISVAKPLIDALAAGHAKLPDGITPQDVRRWTEMVVKSPSSVVLAGPAGATGPAANEIAMAAALLNYAAGRVWQSVDFLRPHAMSKAATDADIGRLLEGLGERDVLIVHNVNLAFIRADGGKIRKAGMVVRLCTMDDETAQLADWVLPIDSPLEAWGDYEPYAGLVSMSQPTMQRLYDTRNAGDILLGLAELAGKPLISTSAFAPPAGVPTDANSLPAPADHGESAFETLLRQRLEAFGKKVAPDKSSADFRRDVLRAGSVLEPAAPTPVLVALRPDVANFRPAAPMAAASPDNAHADLWVYPQIFMFDGRTANRGWLQEAPDPMASIVWGTWIEMHPDHASSLGVKQDDIVRIQATESAGGEFPIEAPVKLSQDVVRGCIAIPLGQGHTHFGRHATGVGANAFGIMGHAQAGMFGQVQLTKTGRRAPTVCVYPTDRQFGRELVQWIDLSVANKMTGLDGDKLRLPLKSAANPKEDMYSGQEHKKHRWAMVIDTQRCIGCGACAVACYAENNIPVMGAGQVAKGREMAWLKVVPYRKPEDDGRLSWLPLLCQQCDAAPCEPVCPVFASVHNEEGLNAQVYNRCIGTRYCSNNCPYKVRRFNWLNVEWPKPLNWQLNPEVTVRSRGVMEKCTFCIQRIRQAELRAKREGRAVRDGEIVPACAQTCPTGAIILGDLLDEKSQVSQLTGCREGIPGDVRRYHVLEELSTKPGVTYLKRIFNDELATSD